MAWSKLLAKVPPKSTVFQIEVVYDDQNQILQKNNIFDPPTANMVKLLQEGNG